MAHLVHAVQPEQRVGSEGADAEGSAVSGQATAAEEQSIAKPVLEKYEREGDPYYGTSLLWDDGVIDPARTREVVGLSLSACLNAPLHETRAPVFRM